MLEINSPTQLKASARNSLTGHYSFLISILLTVGIISFLFYILVYPLTPFVSLIIHLFSFHICRIYLMTFSGEKATIKDLFIGNPDRAKEMQAGYAACILTLIQFLCMLPSNILSLNANSSSVMFLLYCITLTVGMAVFCYIYLCLFPIYYLVSDCPAETITETIRMAVFISKGHRFRLFYLIASFLPLLLLSLLSFGIGLLWVIPYMQATLTHYYLNLTASKSN
ncbi:MAG: DUF975 family protein [Lachnospiraceae bacterium]|nr:DUF975 family protein [Lachnospiraceae bacterium]